MGNSDHGVRRASCRPFVKFSKTVLGTERGKKGRERESLVLSSRLEIE